MSPRTLTVVTRSLELYYQLNGSGGPVAPSLSNPGLDIDLGSKTAMNTRVVELTSDNPFPVSRTTDFAAGHGFSNQSSQDTSQQQYSREFLDSDRRAGMSGAAWFDASFISPDTLGVYDKANRPRTLAIKSYMTAPENHSSLIDQVLLENVGHNEAQPFVGEGIRGGGNEAGVGALKLGGVGYRTLGAFHQNSYLGQPIQVGAGAPSASVVTVDQLQTVAWNIMFDAVQGDSALGFKLTSQSDVAEAEGRMALPSLQRIGKTVKLSRFTAAAEAQKLFGVNLGSKTGFVDNSDQVETHGNYYNPYAQFDSLVSVGQIALCIALILAFVALLDALAAILRIADSTPNAPTLLPEGDRQHGTATAFVNLSDVQRKQLLGASYVHGTGGVYPDSDITAGDVFAQFLGVEGLFTRTFHDAGDSLNEGITEFFGFNFASSAGTTRTQQLATTAARVLTESGRMVTILREVIRSGISVVESGIADFSGGFSIAAVGQLVKRLRDLKIIRFINVLRQIGDKSKFESDLRFQASANYGGSYGRIASSSANLSYVDSLPNERRYLAAKSRLSLTNTLAWGVSTAGMMSLPLNSLSSSGLTELGLGVTPGTVFSGDSGATLGANAESYARAGRLSGDAVAAYERELEADYMPFYVHDLRTNEILPFHAFLEDASDSFQVEYSSTDGYGRMDKVQIYKGTTRTVNVTFKMVATNAVDHSVMWYKLNKLATVIYPQWTAGREISVGQVKFTQPFSQIPGATPVIRLRLGDLFKSNYSKQAVARMFGATTLPGYNVNGSLTAAPTPGPNTTAPTSTASQRARVWNPNFLASAQQQEPFNLNQEVVLKYEHGFPGGPLHVGRRTLSPNPTIRLTATYVGVVQPNGGDPLYQFNLVQAYTGVTESGLVGTGQDVTRPVGRRGQQSPSPQAVTVSLSTANLNNLVDAIRTNQKAAALNAQPVPGSQPRSQSDMTAGSDNLTSQGFYSDDANPLIKAFKSAGGKGLAGVVTSFAIDSKESTWGTDGGASQLRAPIMVTVTMGISVIHDITPGLDANGVMNAPIWPVGPDSNMFVRNQTQPGSESARPSGGSAGAALHQFDPRYNPMINRQG